MIIHDECGPEAFEAWQTSGGDPGVCAETFEGEIARRRMALVGGNTLGYSPYGGIGTTPYTVGGGIIIPGTGGQGSICPPGTACSGPSLEGPFGVALCVGTCKPTGQTGGPPIVEPGPVGGGPGTDVIPGSPGCDLPTQAYCNATCGPGAGAKCRAIGSCQLPNGRGGSLNKSRYYTFGDCRRGTTAGVVQPGTKCVKRRRMNPANAKASSRAARRVTAAIKHQDKLVKAMKKTMRGR